MKKYRKFLNGNETLLQSPSREVVRGVRKSQPVRFLKRKKTRNGNLRVNSSLPLPGATSKGYSYIYANRSQKSFVVTSGNVKLNNEIKKLRQELKSCKKQINFLMSTQGSDSVSVSVVGYHYSRVLTVFMSHTQS